MKTRIETVNLETERYAFKVVASYRIEKVEPVDQTAEIDTGDGNKLRARMRMPPMFGQPEEERTNVLYVLTLTDNTKAETFRIELTEQELGDLHGMLHKITAPPRGNIIGGY